MRVEVIEHCSVVFVFCLVELVFDSVFSRVFFPTVFFLTSGFSHGGC